MRSKKVGQQAVMKIDLNLTRPQSRRHVLGRALALIVTSPASAWAQMPVAPDHANAKKLIDAARQQIGVTTFYDPAYVRLGFPNGDVPPERGVCTDVVIRAYRNAFGFDFQKAVHEDICAEFTAYPRRWSLSAPDPHIDHRRVLNLAVFLTRRGALLPAPKDPAMWQPGDVVTQMIGGKVPHIGILGGLRDATSGRPLVIHNIGRGTQEEDILSAHTITGRFRFLPG